MKIAIIIIAVIVVLFAFGYWQWNELQQFRVKKYKIYTDKVRENINMVMISDLHCKEYGNHNYKLIEAVKACNPDCILIVGDLITTTKVDKYQKALEFLAELVMIAPVYYSYGNHERLAEAEWFKGRAEFIAYLATVKQMGVHLLDNEVGTYAHGKDLIDICGLNLDISYFVKFKKRKVLPQEVFDSFDKQLHGSNNFRILLAHSPRYTNEYFIWGPDLTLSGHYHGGLVCLPNGRAIISPSFRLFPPYAAGKTSDGKGKVAITSRGLGTHTFNLRVFNRAELLNIVIKSV